MRQDSAFSISNCNAPGCSNPYSHLSVSSIRPPSILLRYRNTPSSTPQRSFPSVHCPNNSPYATCFEPWNVSPAISYKQSFNPKHPARYAVTFENNVDSKLRRYWVAGATIRIIDCQTDEVIAEKTIYAFEKGLGGTGGARMPWAFAVRCANQEFSDRYPIISFLTKVVKPIGD